MAIAYLKHSFVGKTTQAEPYTAAANARYIMRRSAAHRIFSERMPRNYHAVQRFLKEREDTIRKNGRVCDKFIIAIPRELSAEQAERVLRSWANKVGQNRTPWLMAFHWEDNNPHAHCIFIDADIETGRRVYGTSDKGVVDGLKNIWADTVNEQFAELGLDTRISFDAQQEAEAANDNHIEDKLDMISTHLPDEELPQEPVADVPVSNDLPTDTPLENIDEPLPEDVLNGPLPTEEELAEIPHVDADITPTIVLQGATLGDNARLGAGAAFELRRIRTLQNERQQVRDKYHAAHAAWQQAIAAERQADKDALAAAQHRDVTRQTFIEEHHNILGRKKGFKVSLFGYSYTSPARRAADAAEQQYQYATREAQHAAEAVEHARAYLERMEEEKAIAEAEYDAVQGNEAELQEAAAIMEATVNEYVGELSRENILAMGEDGTLSPEQTKVLLEELGYDRDIDNSLEA